MHTSIADDIKKRFHAACTIRALKMSQVVVELIEQWLETNNVSASVKAQHQSDYQLRSRGA